MVAPWTPRAWTGSAAHDADAGYFTAADALGVGRSILALRGKVANVMDFGATGDGVTDDTAAIQAAVDSFTNYVQTFEVVPGMAYETKTVYFPPGYYKTTATIQGYNRVFVGAGYQPHSTYGSPVILNAHGGTTINCGPYNGENHTITARVVGIAFAITDEGLYNGVCHLNLDGTGALEDYPPGHPLFESVGDWCNEAVVENCYFGRGFVSITKADPQILRCSWDTTPGIQSNYANLYLTNCGEPAYLGATVQGCTFHNTNGDNDEDGTDGIVASGCHNLSVLDSSFYRTREGCVNMTGGGNLFVSRCVKIDGDYMVVANGTAGIRVRDCAALGQYSSRGVQQSNCSSVTVTDNVGF